MLLMPYINFLLLFLLDLIIYLLLYLFRVYIPVVRQLYSLQSDSPDHSGTHLTLYTIIELLLTILPIHCILHLHV